MSNQRLRVVVIPTANYNLLLPQTLLNHVYPYAPPLSLDRASEFVVGGILIQNEKLPLLDFDFTGKRSALSLLEDDTSGYHFVLVKTVTTQSAYRSYAILSHGQPQLREVGADELKALPKADPHRYIAQFVDLPTKLDKKSIVILNLPQLEQELNMS